MPGDDGLPPDGLWRVSLREYLEAVRAGDRELAAERDRRYAEVSAERERALRIKEKADDTALGLARESQKYRDVQANKLREQIENERGDYATNASLAAMSDRFAAELRSLSDKFDSAHRPVVEFMAAQIARTGAVSQTKDGTRLIIGLVVSVLALLVTAGILYGDFVHK